MDDWRELQAWYDEDKAAKIDCNVRPYRDALEKIANATKLTEGEWSDAPRMRLEALLRNVSKTASAALNNSCVRADVIARDP